MPQAFRSAYERLFDSRVDAVLALSAWHVLLHARVRQKMDSRKARRHDAQICLRPTRDRLAYVVPSAAAKAGVMALTQSLAVEWAKYGIRMNGIAPGPFPTTGAQQGLTLGGNFSKFVVTAIL